MSVLLLVVALAVPVEAPKADMKEATAATAAVASVEVLPEVNIICAAKPPADVEMASVGEVSAAKAPVVEVIASVAQAAAAKPETELIPAVGTVAQAAAPDQPVWEPVVQRGSCGLLTLYTRNSFLSGPWGAARRLAAARRLGDADEVKRMEAKLAALLDEAIFGELD